ncbi:alpha-L-rhamnosidase [Puteibacter caeruleilacunae]|nr:alpha-L-rhamnosidase [Puteibacter caeruleilacunae]
MLVVLLGGYHGYAQQTASPVRLRSDLIEHTERVFINGEISQIPFDEISKVVEKPQLVLIGSRQPVLSWSIDDSRHSIMQTAFRVQLSTSRNEWEDQQKLLWDTKENNTDQSMVKYSGAPLNPETNYYWRVKIWNNKGEESDWSAVKGFRTAKVLKAYSSAAYPLQQVDEYPTQVKDITPGLQFVDFGKAAFGRMKMTIDSQERDDTLIVRFGEVITSQGRINRNPGGSRRYRQVEVPLLQGYHTYTVSITKDKRNTGAAAIKMPDYIGDVYPFRYCEVEGKADVRNVSRETVTYPFNDYGAVFECSDQVLNDIWEFCKYSIKATSFTGIYVDGDRERIPYEADAYINQLCHYGVDDEFTLARRSQEYMLFHPTWPTEWILSSVLMAWKDYQYTGNEDFIRQYYSDLKYKSLTELTDDNGLISTRTGRLSVDVQETVHFKGKSLRDIVDWPHKGILGLSNDDSGETDGFVFTDYNAVVNAYHNKALQVMSVMAGIIGEIEDSVYYADRAIAHKKAFNKLLFDKNKGYYRDGVHTDHHALHSNMFALTFGLVPEQHIDKVTDFVKSRGMACSVYGSQHLLDAVYEGEYADYGLQLLTSREDRGWAHAIYDIGTTITLEAWDNKYKPNQDWNHAWGAAPANIIPMRLMGIEPLEPGFKKIRVKPQPANLEWARIISPTIKGDVKMSFRNKVGKQFVMILNLPANTVGEVWVPISGMKAYELSLNGELIDAKRVRNFLVVSNVGSGRHTFELSAQ